jgi:hypothetical protein
MISGNRGKTVQAYKKSWPASLFRPPRTGPLTTWPKPGVPNATVSVRTPCHHGRVRTSTPAACGATLPAPLMGSKNRSESLPTSPAESEGASHSREVRKTHVFRAEPKFPHLGLRSRDRCDVFPVALGVEAIYLNRRGSMKLMLCAAIGTSHWIDG